jgi:glycerol-3-phosphate dehydrogenase
MKDRREQLAGGQFDILVIGAGMFGACIAWSAALRGYSVAVIDKGDFSNATSSNHYKFIHGGIRYLQHLDLVRLRESSSEKSALIRVAPHLAYPMPIVFPTYGHGRRGKALMRGAMLAYDILTLDRNRGIKDPSRRTPNGTTISREQALEMFPGLPRDGLTGAAIFHDGQMYNPARLVLAFLQSAASKGTVAVNYVRAERLVHEGDKVVGVVATDALSGARYDIRARMVINAAGPWGHLLLRDDPPAAIRPEPSFSRDLAFVIDKTVCGTHAVGCQSESTDSDAIIDRGGRHLFLVPWRNKTLVGVWHRYTRGHPDRIEVSLEELQDYVDEINAAYDGLDITVDDIMMINTGHILFGSQDAQGSAKEHSFAKRSLIIDHAEHGVHGLVSVVGARATVARSIAEKIMNLVQQKMDDRITPSNTHELPIHGGNFEDFSAIVDAVRLELPDTSKHAAAAIAHNYGSDFMAIFDCAEEPKLRQAIGNSSVIRAEVVHAVRNEMARTLADIVLRRTELGSGGDPGQEEIAEAAEIAAKELSWGEEQRQSEVRSLNEMLKKCGPWNIVEHLPQEG